MKIDPRLESASSRSVLKDEILRARNLGPLIEPVCTPDCPDYNVDIGCDRACSKAPLRLSSDPEAFPVEVLIAPLVFEIKKLGVFYPCWSCEGHTNNSGDLWKLPSVWFYADSVVHLRAFANVINALHASGVLKTPWHIILTFSDPKNPDTTFGLEPTNHDGIKSLLDLQADIVVITENLETHFWQECAKLAANASEN